MVLKRREWRKSRAAKARLELVEGFLCTVSVSLLLSMFAVQLVLLVPSARWALTWVDQREGKPLTDDFYGRRWLGIERGVIVLVIPGEQEGSLGVLVNGRQRTRLSRGERAIIPVKDLDVLAVEPPGQVQVVGVSSAVLAPREGQLITGAGFRVRIGREKEETGR